MGQVPPEVGKVLLHQLLIALDDEEILRVLLLRRLREIEQARDQRLYACSSQTARGVFLARCFAARTSRWYVEISSSSYIMREACGYPLVGLHRACLSRKPGYKVIEPLALWYGAS